MSLRQTQQTCVFTLFFHVVCPDWSLGRDVLTSPRCHNNCYRRRSGGWAREASSWLDSLMMSSAAGSPSPCSAVSFQERKNKSLTFLAAVPQVATSEADYPLYANDKFLLPRPYCEILDSQWVSESVNQRFGVAQRSEAGLRMSKSFLFTHLMTWCLGIDRRYISFKLLIYLRWRTSKHNLASPSTEGPPSTNQLKWS